jgi:hypothetical protein
MVARSEVEGMANLEDVGVGHGDDRSAVVLRSCGPFHLWVGGGCECEVVVQDGLMVWGEVYAKEESGGVHAKGNLLVERSRPVVLHLASLCWMTKIKININKIEINNK